jgi:PAS domain S-box-containing protein
MAARRPSRPADDSETAHNGGSPRPTPPHDNARVEVGQNLRANAESLDQLRARARRAGELEELLARLEVYHEEIRGQNEQLLEAQVALEQAVVRYTDLFELAPAAYVTLDRNGIIIAANRAALTLLRVREKAALGAPLLFYVAPGDHKRYLELIRMGRRQGEVRDEEREALTAEVSIKARDGHLVPVMLSLRLAAGEHGRGMLFRAILSDLSERKRAEAELTRYQQQMAAMAVESAMTAERERRRIAVEVHDTLSQSLVLAKMKLAGLMKKAAAACVREDVASGLAEATQLVEEVLGQSRTLTFELSPPILYELGLEPALEWLAEWMSKRAGLSVTVERPRQIARLSEERSVLLFQLVRELVTNAVKHAHPHHVVVRPRYRDGRVRITVSDDGRGFDPAAVGAAVASGEGGRATGFGLFSIRTRLEHLQGSLHINSLPGGPTSVTVELPVASGNP